MPAPKSLVECFEGMADPRVRRSRLHPLINILVIAVCATLCGAEGWDDFVEFAVAREEWLAQRLDMSNGIPSADTFRRVFARLDPLALQAMFLMWVQALQEHAASAKSPKIYAIDGKTLRHSFDRATQKSAIHMVGVYCSHARMVLAQAKIDDKSNEITAVPQVLGMLDLLGCIVTADAMSCQKAIVSQITQQQGDYVLGLKANQPHLLEDVGLLFSQALCSKFAGIPFEEYVYLDKAHGRLVERRCLQIDLQALEGRWQDVLDQWPGLRSVVMLESTRQIGTDTSKEVRYYISSLPLNPRKVLRAIRSHWSIENCVHWVLDVVFDEDASRIRKENSPENMAVIRHIALNLLRHETTHKRGIKARRKRAGWDTAYLDKLLSG